MKVHQVRNQAFINSHPSGGKKHMIFCIKMAYKCRVKRLPSRKYDFMSLPGQKTTTSFLEWDRFLNLVQKLERDGELKFAVLIALGVYTGLRISDLKELTW